MTTTIHGTDITGPNWFLDRRALRDLGLARRDGYRAAAPFPHAVFDAFLGDALARALAQRFPGPDHPGWIRRDHAEQSGRLGQLQRQGFAGVEPSVRHLLSEFCGMAFLDFLGALTGVEGLIPDPHFHGAGCSLTLPGGHLDLHADFNRDGRRHLARAVTALYYLGADWDPAWGGALELWGEPRVRCAASYLPLLDRLVILSHGDTHWHGHPSPLACPEGRFRASIASYYYVAAATADESGGHGAIWARRTDAAPRS